MNLFAESGSADSISKELSRICTGKCSLCETEEDTIIGIGFENGGEPKRICPNCWKYLRELATRKWSDAEAVITIFKKKEGRIPPEELYTLITED